MILVIIITWLSYGIFNAVQLFEDIDNDDIDHFWSYVTISLVIAAAPIFFILRAIKGIFGSNVYEI